MHSFRDFDKILIVFYNDEPPLQFMISKNQAMEIHDHTDKTVINTNSP